MLARRSAASSVPEDVAAAVVWLVSSANPYANGQKININGGG